MVELLPESPLLGPDKEHHYALPRPNVLDDVSLIWDRLQGEDSMFRLSNIVAISFWGIAGNERASSLAGRSHFRHR